MEYDLLEEHGFEEMYHDYFPKIYNYIFYRILSKEETEDLVSEVFFKVARNAASFDPRKAGFSTWIYNIAKNTLTDHYRRKKPALVSGRQMQAEPAEEFETQLEQISFEKRKVVFRELSTLKERERLIVYYKFFEEYTNRQIAAILDMNESTVGTVLSRTLKKLRTDDMRELRMQER